ncbi:MAG: DUF962 domain-containing protein [Planctomycetaceae bacterium]
MSRMDSSSQLQFSKFSEFWSHYLTQHSHPANQLLHVVGTIGGLVCVGLTAYRSWWWLLLVLPVGYGIAWFGHFFIERNRPLTFKYPLWSLRADYLLVGLILSGRSPSRELHKKRAG